jgi:hypothetical protein
VVATRRHSSCKKKKKKVQCNRLTAFPRSCLRSTTATSHNTMPKIKSFAPGWLNQPAPGHKLFASSIDDSLPAPLAQTQKSRPGRRQTVARRGTEVFVAAGKQIRWGDFVYLKESWEGKQRNGGARYRREEESDGSFEVYDEEATTAGSMVEGYRVRTPILSHSLCLRAPTNDRKYRRSRHRWPTT